MLKRPETKRESLERERAMSLGDIDTREKREEKT